MLFSFLKQYFLVMKCGKWIKKEPVVLEPAYSIFPISLFQLRSPPSSYAPSRWLLWKTIKEVRIQGTVWQRWFDVHSTLSDEHLWDQDTCYY